MNGGIVPLLLLGVSFAFAMSFADRRSALAGLAALWASALIATLLPWPAELEIPILTGLLASMIATAALVHFPPPLALPVAATAGIVDGIWLGAVAVVSGDYGHLALALASAILIIPGQWARKHGYAIVTKVLASWMMAIAALSILVSMVPTPGYEADHME